MNCYISQHFGENDNPSYSKEGLKGHTGVDEVCGFGSPIYSPYDGFAYKVLTPEQPSNDGSGFTGVFLIVDNGVECFEYLIGHCNPTIAAGTVVKKGDLIGTEANHGDVFVGSTQITLAMQAAGDTRGHHRHVQKRPVRPTKTIVQPALSAQNDLAGTYRDANGNYYQVWDYYNGYHGCVDPDLPLFTRNLFWGRSGYDVWCLQRFLVKHGFATFEPTGYYGPLTTAAVARFQSATGAFPAVGFFGPITRGKINPILPK